MKRDIKIITIIIIFILLLTVSIMKLIRNNKKKYDRSNITKKINFTFQEKLRMNIKIDDYQDKTLNEQIDEIQKVKRRKRKKQNQIKKTKKVKKSSIPIISNNYTFQIASYKDLEQAIYLKSKLISDFNNVKVVKVELENKGIFYRVIIEPVSEKAKESTIIQLEENYGIKPWIIPLRK